jgi:dual-specificity kinase
MQYNYSTSNGPADRSAMANVMSSASNNNNGVGMMMGNPPASGRVAGGSGMLSKSTMQMQPGAAPPMMSKADAVNQQYQQQQQYMMQQQQQPSYMQQQQQPSAYSGAASMQQQQQQQMPQQDGVEQPRRLSGGKRDADTAAGTDVINQVPLSYNGNPSVGGSGIAGAAGGAVGQMAVKKQKITYQLPSQNMEEGHFYVVLGEDVDVSTARFKILSLLGEGTFGKVVEAWDRKRKEYCAVKIVRNVAKYTRDAEYEIRFMERIRKADEADNFAMMKIQRHFRNDDNHVCIVMNKYGPCLLDHLQKHGPFPHRHLAEIIFHAGAALDHMHSELHLMHTDLKPENMLLETSKLVPDPVTGRQVPQLPCRIRICDLGGCCDENHSKSAIVSTRHYRAPEVILGLGWMYSCDLWSMGCIIYELATGRLLYDTHENVEHLHMMEKTLGRLPAEWGKQVQREDAVKCYTPQGTLQPLKDPKSQARVGRCRRITEVISDELLRELVMSLLCYDKERRLTARGMCQHPYVLKYFPEALSHATHPRNRAALLKPSPKW